MLFSCLAICIALLFLYKGRLVGTYYLILIWYLNFITLILLANIIIIFHYYNNQHYVERLDHLYLVVSKGIVQIPSYQENIKGINFCVIDEDRKYQDKITKMRNRIIWKNLEWQRIFEFWEKILL